MTKKTKNSIRAKWDNDIDEDSDEFGIDQFILWLFVAGAIFIVFF